MNQSHFFFLLVTLNGLRIPSDEMFSCYFAPFFLHTCLKIFNGTGSSLPHFLFLILHTVSIRESSGLQTGQSSICTLFFHSHAFVMCASTGDPLSIFAPQRLLLQQLMIDKYSKHCFSIINNFF